MLEHLFSRCASWGSSAGSRLYIFLARVRKPLSVEPHFCCLWATGHYEQPHFPPCPSPSRTQGKISSSLSWPCLYRICTHQKLYLSTLGNTSYLSFRNMFFSQWLFPWGCQRFLCRALCAGGRFGRVRHQLPQPEPLLMQNRVHKSIQIWPWMRAKHPGPEFEWTNLKENSCIKLSRVTHNKHELTGPPAGRSGIHVMVTGGTEMN